MSRQAKPLTVISARNAKPGRHADGKGLYLLVKPSGARSWLLRVQVSGRRRDIGLGAFDVLPLAEARVKAAKLRAVAMDGIDPTIERDKNKTPIPSFAIATRSAHDEFGKGWSPKQAASFLSSLETHAFPTLGNRRVDVIDHAMVRDALAPIWTDKPDMARKVRVRINQVLGFARSKNWRTAPVPLSKEIQTGLSKQGKGGKFAAMPYCDTPAFLSRMRDSGDTTGKLALLFTILTASRNGEVRAATWEQFDLDKGLWNRPASIMKMREPHTVTLSQEAIDVLAKARPLSGGVAKALVFPGTSGRKLSDMTLTKAMRTAGVADYTVHGFRSAFRDWAAEKMPTVPSMVAEMALAHSVGTAVERAYLRTDLREQRATLMAAWGRFCMGHADNVVRLAASNG